MAFSRQMSRPRFHTIYDSLVNYGDHYQLLADFGSYVAAQDDVDALYRQKVRWTRAALKNVAGMGHFSSDRSIAEYARNIWRTAPLDLRNGVKVDLESY